ncbi:hypothetical protein FPV67DRAFT_1457538 [Lyophyllum atratum]|nr:hypothetical protein FPV67DRAFT_1457538 [Lyophyllum atratum]
MGNSNSKLALPAELYQLILDHVAGDTTALSTLASTSKPIREIAQERLFCAITIQRNYTSGLGDWYYHGGKMARERSQRTLDKIVFFAENPRLAGYVRSLSICLYREGANSMETSCEYPLHIIFLNLSRLTLEAGSWGDIDAELQADLLAMFRSPSLRMLDLAVDSLPAREIGLLDQLEHLVLECRGATHITTPTPTSTGAPNRNAHGLRTLALSSSRSAKFMYDILRNPSATVSVAHLLNLEVTWELTPEEDEPPLPITSVIHVLRLTAATLETLHLRIAYASVSDNGLSNPHGTSLKLPKMRNLKFLQITDDGFYGDEITRASLARFIADVLSSLGDPNNLSQLVLAFTYALTHIEFTHIWKWARGEPEQFADICSAWGAIDEQLFRLLQGPKTRIIIRSKVAGRYEERGSAYRRPDDDGSGYDSDDEWMDSKAFRTMIPLTIGAASWTQKKYGERSWWIKLEG